MADAFRVQVHPFKPRRRRRGGRNECFFKLIFFIHRRCDR